MARNKYDIDEVLETPFNISYFKRVYGYMKRYKKGLLSGLAIIMLCSLGATVGPALIKWAVDIITENAGGGLAIQVLAAIVGIMVCYAIISVVSALLLKTKTRIMTKTGQSIIGDIRYDLFTHIQKLSFSYFDSRPHGKILVRVVNYVNSISDFLSNGVINCISDIFTLVIIIVFMLAINTELALVCMIPLPFFFVFLILMRKKQHIAWQIQSAKLSNMNAYIHENIIGIKVAQSFNRDVENQSIFKRICDEAKEAWMRTQRYAKLIWPTVDFLSSIGLAILFGYSISRISGGGLSIGTLVAFTAYLSMFWGPILNLSNFYNQIINVMAYLERIFETMDTEPDVHDKPNAIEMKPIVGEVTFRDVVFGYEDGVEILKGVNFTVKPGDTIALVGPTGAGKTTIINLLSRFYDVNSGQVLIDGQDISEVTLESLRKQMGVMLQDTFIFSGTIMDNIRYGKLDATDEEVVAAAKVVSAHDFIMTLENGYYTEVNERGSRLSVGQRQLISFARALLASPKILILDEATSSIDTKTELILQQGLNQLLKGRTSFIIAHRLSTIKNATRIMYIDHGNIMEAGTHDELIAKKGYYYELYRSQYSFLETM